MKHLSKAGLMAFIDAGKAKIAQQEKSEKVRVPKLMKLTPAPDGGLDIEIGFEDVSPAVARKRFMRARARLFGR